MVVDGQQRRQTQRRMLRLTIASTGARVIQIAARLT